MLNGILWLYSIVHYTSDTVRNPTVAEYSVPLWTSWCKKWCKIKYSFTVGLLVYSEQNSLVEIGDIKYGPRWLVGVGGGGGVEPLFTLSWAAVTTSLNINPSSNHWRMGLGGVWAKGAAKHPNHIISSLQQCRYTDHVLFHCLTVVQWVGPEPWS